MDESIIPLPRFLMPAIPPNWDRAMPCSGKIVLDERPFIDDATRRYGHDFLSKKVCLAGRIAFISHARRFTSRYHQPQVISFLLRFSHPQRNISDVRVWLSLATRSLIKEMEIDFSDPDNGSVCTNTFPMPNEVHQLSHFLRSLRLLGCGITWDVTTSFVALRTLSIERAEIHGPSLDVLLMSCPFLEELTLVKLRLHDIKIVNRTRRLCRLTIEDCEQKSLEVSVEAPMLTYFKYSGNVKLFPLILPKVEEAILDFGSEPKFYKLGGILCTLLESLRSTKSLMVCSYMTQVVPTGRDPFFLPAPAQFHHLKHMLLRTELHQDELPGIALLLRSYEKLQSITFRMGNRNVLQILNILTKIFQNYEYPFEDVDENFYFWRDQNFPIPCLERSLQKVIIEGFRAKIDELAIIDFFVKRAKRLKEIIIIVCKETPINVEAYIAVAERIEHCKKRSPHLKIVVS